MQDYDIKRGSYSNLEGDGLLNIMKGLFGNAKREGGALVSSYGALDKLTVVVKSKTVMTVDTKMNPSVSNDVARDTVSKYNEFLLAATGFTSKERKKRLNQKAKQGDI